MKVDTTKVLTDDLEGGPIKTPEGKKNMTVGWILRQSLLFGHPGAPLSADEHMRRHELAEKLKHDSPDLTAEEVVACKKAVAEAWKISAIVGQACKALEGK